MRNTTIHQSAGILVPTVEEVPRISDAERESLRNSLEAARADIASGNYDVLDRKTLRAEFVQVFDGDDTEENHGLPTTRR